MLNLGDNHPENSKERTTFHKKALDLYEKVDTRMDLTVGNVVDIAKGLHRLGDHKKALTLYYKALESQSKTVDDILNIAYGFLKFANASPKDSDERNAYLERAAELFEKATNKLNDLSCAQSGVNGFRSLEKMYPEGSPEQIFYHKKVERLSGFAGAHGFV